MKYILLTISLAVFFWGLLEPNPSGIGLPVILIALTSFRKSREG
jgi:hypothetical protein